MAPPRRLALPALSALALAGLAVGIAVPRATGGSNLADRQAEIVAELADLRATVAAAKKREKVLTSDIDAASDQIDLVGDQLTHEQARLVELSGELDGSEARLAELREDVGEVTDLLELQRGQERVAQRRLEARLVELYKSEPTDEVTEILLRVGDLGQVLNELEYLDRVAESDEDIVVDVRKAKRDSVALRRRTVRLQREVARATAALADQTERQAALRDSVAAREQDLVAAQADRTALLDQVSSGREEAQDDIEDLEEASKSLARKIAALAVARSSGVTTGGGARPSSGFVWPVGGPITSGFGWRWGRMHEGVDIGVGFGTAIHAVAGGTVVYTGWLGGYGNLVVVDHGDGLSTAYAHQQAIHVASGQSVAQGAVLGEVGSTGNSTGPHLHFEVRINGSAVDPLGYL